MFTVLSKILPAPKPASTPARPGAHALLGNARPRLTLIAALVLGAAFMRLLPHPPNFTPIAAIALFGGVHLRPRWLAFAVPLAAMALSDWALHLLWGWGFHALSPVVYGAFAATVVLGATVGRRGMSFGGAAGIAGMAFGAALLFYLTTNFAVWLHLGSYPPTFAGLVACYLAALPYFGATLAGNLVYSLLLFGGFSLAERQFLGLAPARGA